MGPENKIKILIVADNFGINAFGGAEESINSIIEGLIRIGFKLKCMKQSKSKIIKILSYLSLDYIIVYLRVLYQIRKFNPNVIICQRRMSFPTIVCANKKNVPVINLIHGTSLFCPKHTDIIEYGQNCNGLYNRKSCYKCINKWKKLRIEIGNKREGWDKSIKCFLANKYYKFRYFVCKLNLKIMEKATINLVASNLMRYILLPRKSEVLNISPIPLITNRSILRKSDQILFVVPSYNVAHKGLDFVKKLSKIIPKGYTIKIVGNNDLDIQTENTLSIGRISKWGLNDLYKISKLTIFPSFCTEGFGRVVVESILNGTPVICSANCGVAHNEIFLGKDYIKICSININEWKKEIAKMLNYPVEISMEEKQKIKEKFSEEDCAKELKEIIIDLDKEKQNI